MSARQEDYSKFCQDVLLACADAQHGDQTVPLDIEALCQTQFPTAPPTWVENITKTLVGQGFGDDWSTMDGHRFLITGAGLLEADAIRKMRNPKSFVERIRDVPRSDWISLTAVVVSLIALFK